MKTALAWLASIFEDHRGGASWSRITSTLVLGDILYVWTLTSLKATTALTIDPQLALMVASILGLTMAKSAFGEKSTP